MILRDTDLTEIITTLYVGGRGPASQDISRQSVPNRPGSYFQNKSIPERILTVRFLIKGADMYELRTNLDEFNKMLYPDDLTSDERKKGYSLVFPDEPDMTYFGLPDGSPDWSEISDKGIGEITFVCFDPHKYGVEQSMLLNATSGNIVTNAGGKETYPLITATVLQPTTFFTFYTPDKYMMLGAPVTVEKTPIEKEESLIRNDGANMTGLVDGTYIDGGTVTGEMYTTGTVFSVDDFGSGPDWVGPAKKVSLATPIQDFRVDAYVTVDSGGNQGIFEVGRVEIYLLDVSNNVIGKMAMVDNRAGMTGNVGEVRAGGMLDGHMIINRRNKEWTPFRHGVISLERVGTKFKAYIAQRKEDNTNKHYADRTAYFNDVDLEYQDQLAQIQIHIGAYASEDVPLMGIHAFEVFRINGDTETEVPYIAMPGDVLTIDHNTKEIRKNGKDFKQAKDFGSSLFPLLRGNSTVGIYPDNVADVELKWRERWL